MHAVHMQFMMFLIFRILEFLNGLRCSGNAEFHEINMKVCIIIMLLRNIDHFIGLYFTHLVVTGFGNYILVATILVGSNYGQNMLIFRMFISIRPMTPIQIRKKIILSYCSVCYDNQHRQGQSLSSMWAFYLKKYINFLLCTMDILNVLQHVWILKF